MKNGIEDLRNHLFAAIESVLDTEKPLEIERAMTVAKLAQVLINSAKVEVDFAEATTLTVSSSFFQKPEQPAKMNRLPHAEPVAPKLLAGNRK